jgi:molybdate transport system ATP-binding protein
MKCEDRKTAEDLLSQFGLEHLSDSFVINLSNGEQRKLELIKALAAKPDLLVLDNAFTGLDSSSRPLLAQMLEKLIADRHTIVMTGLEPGDFPPSVKTFIVLRDGFVKQICKREELPVEEIDTIECKTMPIRWAGSTFAELVYLNKVSLQYGQHKILDKVDWLINTGERWSLTGPNGSGKTSLLNLIFGDNPKAYGCDIRLFGEQKGSGESIWDIKARIGFVSPELHQFLPQNQTVADVICSGFNEAESTFRNPTGYQRDVAQQWLKTLGYANIGSRVFGELSTSAQRVVLFIRTLVKSPPLLILDEPFQGLDTAHVRLLKDLLCRISNETNCAMVFVTHLPDELPGCFTFHLRLDKGKVI